MSDQEIVDKLEQVWGSIAALCQPLSEPDWKRATDCPKWSVQDHVSHIVGTESRLAGRPVPDHTPQEMGHVHNDIGRGQRNMGGLPAPALRCAGARGVSRRHGGAAATTAQHERGRLFGTHPDPGRSGHGARFHGHSHLRLLGCTSRTYGAPSGAPVTWRGRWWFIPWTAWSGRCPSWSARKPPPRTAAPSYSRSPARRGARWPWALAADEPPLSIRRPRRRTCALTMDVETFTCLGNGRWEGSQALARGRVDIDGDRELGERIAAGMNFMV